MARTLEKYQMIERSIIKKYRRALWTLFTHAVKKYELIQPGDRIAVCISGGKDSMLMAKLMQELHRHSDVPFDLVFLVMDPGYNAVNRQKIEANAIHAVAQDTFPGWKTGGVAHSFLEGYAQHAAKKP